MKRIFIFFMLLFSLIHMSLAQLNHGINWITGRGNSYKLHFKDTLPFVSGFDFNYNYYFKPGTSCISDSDGYLKLICNGCQLYDSLGTVVDGGDTLTPVSLCNWFSGSISYAQASVILPLGNNKYSVITATVSDSVFNNVWLQQNNTYPQAYDILQQHIVDMNLNGGNGKVIKKQILLKDVPLSRTQMMACRHADGNSWWLLKQGKDSNRVYKYVITADSVYNYGSQKFEEPLWGNFDQRGQSMFSNTGRIYATVAEGKNLAFLAEFNRCSGELSIPKIITPPVKPKVPNQPTWLDSYPYGICFSPNDSFLYVQTAFNIYQLDLYDLDSLTAWHHVANLDTNYDQFLEWNTIYPSPDGRIFVGNRDGVGKAMSTIDNPNVKGAGCNFCPKCFRFGLIGAGNPPCMPNYALGKDTTVNCWPMGLPGEVQEIETNMAIYPNPTQSQLTVESEAFKKGLNYLRIFNLMGQCVLEKEFKTASGKHTVDVRGLPEGMYVVRVNGMVRRMVVE